jgi:hypothetical protein
VVKKGPFEVEAEHGRKVLCCGNDFAAGLWCEKLMDFMLLALAVLVGLLMVPK